MILQHFSRLCVVLFTAMAWPGFSFARIALHFQQVWQWKRLKRNAQWLKQVTRDVLRAYLRAKIAHARFIVSEHNRLERLREKGGAALLTMVPPSPSIDAANVATATAFVAVHDKITGKSSNGSGRGFDLTDVFALLEQDEDAKLRQVNTMTSPLPVCNRSRKPSFPLHLYIFVAKMNSTVSSTGWICA